MSIRSWNKTWGKLVPLLQTKLNSEQENKLLDRKIAHEIYRYLLKKTNIDDISPIVQCTILHLCIGKGLIKSAKLLIQAGADTQKTNRFHEKPYDYICYAKYNQDKMKKLFQTTPFLSHEKSRE